MDPIQHKSLVEIARREKRSISDVVREMITNQLAEHRRQKLAEAARALLMDYSGEGELTIFTALDGEDFNA
jgi:hypothetical protein